MDGNNSEYSPTSTPTEEQSSASKTTPLKFSSLQDIYDNTEEIDIALFTCKSQNFEDAAEDI